ncbi:MAG: hypothetical protein JRG84_08260 [Deltaproteobacteria bacterium]|nr:hypothetical protein [Deltaproteobacteria bacterium]
MQEDDDAGGFALADAAHAFAAGRAAGGRSIATARSPTSDSSKLNATPNASSASFGPTPDPTPTLTGSLRAPRRMLKKGFGSR